MKHLITVILVLMQTTLCAKTAVILSTSNTVKGALSGVSRVLQRGDSLNAGDTIVTGNNAIARIKYSNGTLVSIAPNSSYKIIAYAPEAEEQLKAELASGTMVSKTNGRTKESLKTPVIAMAILGTEYAVSVKGPKKTYVHIRDGSVRLGGELLGPGDSVLATPSGIINAPFPEMDFITTELAQLENENANSSEFFPEDLSSQDTTSENDINTTPEGIVDDVNSAFTIGNIIEGDLEDVQTLASNYP